MSDNHELLSNIDAFLAESGMADSSFGRAAVNDWKFVRDLRSGKRRVWPETAKKVLKFIEQQRAEKAAA